MAVLHKKQTLLMPGAKRGRWRSNRGTESSDRDFGMVRPKVLARDGGKCVFCGLKIDKMHVHHVNDNHEVNDMPNLVTVDELCHAVNHVGLTGKTAVMIYMPGVTQVDVNHLCRTIAVAISFGGETGEKAQKLSDMIIAKFSPPVAQSFGSSSPADFGNALIAMSDDGYVNRHIPLRDVKVFFRPECMGDFVARSRKAMYENLPTDQWGRLHDDFMGSED